MTDKIIPITPLYQRYRELRGAHQAERLAYARDVLANPALLADEFVTTIAVFGKYNNPEQPFYGKRTKHEFGPALESTNDLVLRLDALRRIDPSDATDRLTGATGHRDVIDVPPADLAFEYVDRELLLHRTLSPARWDNGDANRGGLRPDILLANAHDRTPIVAELKLPGDMDPFFALIQALAGAAHLATPHQYQRLRNHEKRGNFPSLTTPPRLTSTHCSSARPKDQTSPNSPKPRGPSHHSCWQTTDSHARSGTSPESASA